MADLCRQNPLGPQIEITYLPGCEPSKATEGSSGYDLSAVLHRPCTLKSGERYLFATGVHLAIPPGYEAQIRPRSSLAFNHGITVLNSPGTIDSDYRGEVKVLLVNNGYRDFLVCKGMRIAQLVFSKVTHPEFLSVDTLTTTLRNDKGFGSTGK